MHKAHYIFIFIISLAISKMNAQKTAFNLLADTTILCQGDSVVLKVNENNFSKNAFYQWQTPNIIITRTKELAIRQKGKYTLKIIDDKKTYYDTTYVKLVDKPKFHLKDTVLCSGRNLLLSVPKNKHYKYNWSNGENTSFTDIEKSGSYWLKITNNGCSYTDTFKVNTSIGTIPNFGKEYLVCESETNKILSVKAPSGVKLYWNTGANTSSINVSKEGTYWVKSVSKTCGTKSDSVQVKFKNCDCDIFIPNSFSPNEDEKNDTFAPIFQCDYSYFSLNIMDRWGNTVYTSTNINGKWDGRFKNNPCPDDVYVYRLEAIQKTNDKKIIRNGHISLFR